MISLKRAPKQADGTPVVAQTGRMGSEAIYSTHNFCDESTWYSESIRVTSGTLTYNTGTGLWESGDPCWVDMTHGRVFDEEGLIEDQQIFEPSDPHGYEIKVWVDGVEKSQRSPFATTGGDYTVDYYAGTVSGSWSSGSLVSASYSKKGASGWILQPLPNKVLTMEKAEVQFASDIEMRSTFTMQVFGSASFFAPQLIQSNGGPLPDDSKVPLETTKYKTVDQIIDEAIMAVPVIPPLSTGSGGRGYQKSRNVFQFHYGAVRNLYSSLGLQVRIFVEDDVSFDGERATATFYCTSHDDPGATEALTEMGLL